MRTENGKRYEGNGISCADALASMLSTVGKLDYMAVWWWGCAFKYLWRWPHKGGSSDLDKAVDCLQRLKKEILTPRDVDGKPIAIGDLVWLYKTGNTDPYAVEHFNEDSYGIHTVSARNASGYVFDLFPYALTHNAPKVDKTDAG